MSSRVTLIDYGSGNLHSVIKALRETGVDVCVTEQPDDVRCADRVVLPGVGAFGDGMGGLQKRNLIPALADFFAAGRPFLGICLGMQMLLSKSEEFGSCLGLDIIPGRVVAIPYRPGVKVPHIGWSQVFPPQPGRWAGSILEGVPVGTRVYFVHSFSAVPDREEDRLADTDCGGFRVSAAIQHGNITGCQFHPEKSGPAGLVILKRFLQL